MGVFMGVFPFDLRSTVIGLKCDQTELKFKYILYVIVNCQFQVNGLNICFLDISLLSHILSLCPSQDVHKATELEKAMEKQKLKIDLKSESDVV